MNRECHHYCGWNSSCISLGDGYSCFYSGCPEGYKNDNRFGQICYPDRRLPNHERRRVEFYKTDGVFVPRQCLATSSETSPVTIYRFDEEFSLQREIPNIRTKMVDKHGFFVPKEENFLNFTGFNLQIVKPLKKSRFLITTAWLYSQKHIYELYLYVE